jgi:putative FmdB family regulatory protein
MPIYEYRCEACAHELEVIQKMNAPLLTDCPACGKAKLIKKISAAGFQLKGSGWYVTDFRSGGKKPTDSSSKDGGGKSADEKKSSDSASSNSAAQSSDSKSADAKPAASTATSTSSDS